MRVQHRSGKYLMITIALAALSMAALMSSSTPAAAGPANLTVYGYVLDLEGQPIEGADVLVEVLAGSYPSRSTTTDSDGFYQVDFDLSDWNIGDTVRSTATYDSNPVDGTAVADASTVVQIDLQYSFAIPEFGTFGGVVVATVLIGAIAVISMNKRKA